MYAKNSVIYSPNANTLLSPKNSIRTSSFNVFCLSYFPQNTSLEFLPKNPHTIT